MGRTTNEPGKGVRARFKEWFFAAYMKWMGEQPLNLEAAADVSAFAKFLGVTSFNAYRFIRGNTVPRGADLTAISSRLGPDVYFTLGRQAPG
mgnify:CR=1 FL=1